MATYTVETDKGTYEVETEDAPAEKSLGQRVSDELGSQFQTAKDSAKGVVKGALNTGLGFGNMMTFGLQNFALEHQRAPQTLSGLVAGEQPKTARQQIEEQLTPHGEAQRAGYNVEQGAEYLIPIPGLEEAKAVQGAGNLAKAGFKAGVKRFAETGLKQGTKAGLIGTAQTGDVEQGAEQAAFAATTAPIVQQLSRFVSPLMKRSAQRIYQRVLIPGGGPKFNKQVAQDAATELIERGHMALTRGHLVDQTTANVDRFAGEINAAEDRALETMGFRPKGTSTTRATQVPFTETQGPIIDVGESSGVPAVISKAVARPMAGLSRPLGAAGDGTSTRTGYRTAYDTVRETTPPGKLDAKPILQRMSEALKGFRIEGKIPEGYQTLHSAQVNMMQDIRRFMDVNGELNIDSAIQLRRAWDKLANWEKGDLTFTEAQKKAYRSAANALRNQIAEHVPGMAEANKQYSFWTGIDGVLHDKELQQVGHKEGGLTRVLLHGAGLAAGGAGGYAHGGGVGSAEGAAAGFILAGALDKIAESAGVKTLSSVTLDRLGQMLTARRYTQALNYLSLAGSQVVRPPQTPQQTSAVPVQ